MGKVFPFQQLLFPECHALEELFNNTISNWREFAWLLYTYTFIDICFQIKHLLTYDNMDQYLYTFYLPHMISLWCPSGFHENLFESLEVIAYVFPYFIDTICKRGFLVTTVFHSSMSNVLMDSQWSSVTTQDVFDCANGCCYLVDNFLLKKLLLEKYFLCHFVK